MQVNLSTQIGECENQSWLLLLPREGGCLAVVLGRKVEVYFGLMNRSGPAWVKVGQIETCPAISQVSGAARAVCFSNRMQGRATQLHEEQLKRGKNLANLTLEKIAKSCQNVMPSVAIS